MSKKKSPLRLTWGTDPELMLYNEKTCKIVNAIPVFKHGKNNPLDLGDGFKAYTDNVLVEFQTPPAEDKTAFIANLLNAFGRISGALESGYSLRAKAANWYDYTELGQKPNEGDAEIPDAWQIGCTANFDGYTGKPNDIKAFDDNWRTGSFHLHIGNADWKSGKDNRLMTHDSKIEAVRLLDIFVGCAAIIICCDTSSRHRRKYYGKAGEFRPTPYGIEYRVLENYYLRQPTMVDLMIDLASHAMFHVSEDTGQDVLKLVDASDVRTAINEDNMTVARKVLDRAKLSGSLVKRITDAQRAYGISENPFEGWGLVAVHSAAASDPVWPEGSYEY